MGKNTMTFFQKRVIVSASMKLYSDVCELHRALTGHNTKECIRINKLHTSASNNVRYWIDRPVLEMTPEENQKTAQYLDSIWKHLQETERRKDSEHFMSRNLAIDKSGDINGTTE